MPDQLDHPRQRRLARRAEHTRGERTFAIDRACKHLVARLLFHRQRFAGEPRLVDVRSAGENLGIQRHPGSRADENGLIREHRPDGHRNRLITANDHPLLRRQVEQSADGLRRPPLGPDLQILAERHEREDHPGIHEGHRRMVCHTRRTETMDEMHHTARVGGSRTQGNQRIHVGRKIPRPQGSAEKVGPSHIELQSRGHGKLGPDQGGTGKEPAKRQGHLDAEEQRPGNEPPLPGGPLARLLLDLPQSQVFLGLDHLGTVAAAVERLDQLFGADPIRIEHHRRLPAHQVDPRGADPVESRQSPLDQRNASRAVHPLHVEQDMGGGQVR